MWKFDTMLAQRWIKVLLQTKDQLVIQTTKLIDTLFYIQTFGWHLDNIQPDDYKVNGKEMERNILYYYK